MRASYLGTLTQSSKNRSSRNALERELAANRPSR